MRLADIGNERLPGERTPPREGWGFVLQRIERWFDPSVMEPPWVSTVDEVAKAYLLPAIRGSEGLERGVPTFTVFLQQEYAAAFLAQRGWTDVTADWPRAMPEEELPERERALLAKMGDWKSTSALAMQAGLSEEEALQGLWFLLLRGEVEQGNHWRLWRRWVGGEGVATPASDVIARVRSFLEKNIHEVQEALRGGLLDEGLDLVWEEEKKREKPRATMQEYITRRRRQLQREQEAAALSATSPPPPPPVPEPVFQGPAPEATAPLPLGQEG